MAMDDIQRVDCFERLYQHLLRHDPEIQKPIAALLPYCYRSQNQAFFLTHLVALQSGLDERTAEGRRRIRRVVNELVPASPGEVGERMIVRESAGTLEKRFSDAQKDRLRKALGNLQVLFDSNESAGQTFDAEMKRLENLPDRIGWVRRQMPCLTGLNAFRFLNRIGYPVPVPDRPVQTLLLRLGLIEQSGGSPAHLLDASHAVDSVARALQRSVLEIDYWMHLFVGTVADAGPDMALCRATPRCAACPLQAHCHYYRFRRPSVREGTIPLPVKRWREKDRPRERLRQLGAHRLDDAELLAIVLRTGADGLNVIDLARHLLDRFGDLHGIEEAAVEELCLVHGIGPMKAVELKAVFELGRRLAYRPLQPGESITSAEDVYRGYQSRFSRLKQEEFVLLMLDKKNRVIREETISRGGLDMSIVHPREVFKAAIRASAASVIFVHNHPSGDPTPSHDDYSITRRLEEAGRLLQIEVLDHIVIGNASFYSFVEEKVMAPEKLQSFTQPGSRQEEDAADGV